MSDSEAGRHADGSADIDPIDSFDETNGLAPGLDGDDGGAEGGESNRTYETDGDGDETTDSILNDIVDRAAHGESFESKREYGDDDSTTNYSEEGAP